MSKQAVIERRRAARIEAERAARAQETRTKRLWRLGAAVAAAVILAGVGVAVSSSGGTKPAPPASTSSLLAGIPENHGVLGDPKAPLTVTEYVDLQCPICAKAAQSTVPALIRDEVRTGKVKLQVRTLSFLGEDSVRAARVAAGAERQGRLWPFLEAFYARQGTENSGYVTDGFLNDVSKAAGVNASQAIGQADSAFASGRLQRADADASRMNVQGTPTLTVKRGNGPERVLQASPLDAAAVQAELNAAAAR
jgi:protein-disulfide isomerase